MDDELKRLLKAEDSKVPYKLHDRAMTYLTKQFNLAPKDFVFLNVWEFDDNVLLLYNIINKASGHYHSAVAYLT